MIVACNQAERERERKRNKLFALLAPLLSREQSFPTIGNISYYTHSKAFTNGNSVGACPFSAIVRVVGYMKYVHREFHVTIEFEMIEM